MNTITDKPKKAMFQGHRTMEQLKEHYEIEKELAAKLRNASREDRRHLYTTLYDELFQRVTHHSQLTQKASPQEKEFAAAKQMNFINPFLVKDITFLEVGPGDCALSFEVAKLAKQVYAIDISESITSGMTQPPNFHLIISDGTSIPLPPNSINVAYSNQLMEHLHPDDAFEQMENIYNTLIPGGIYICITPNRLNGPHDISRHFDEVATGLHLKEYTSFELVRLFKKAGFSQVKLYFSIRKKYRILPTLPIIIYEKFLEIIPKALREYFLRTPPFSYLIGTRFVAIK